MLSLGLSLGRTLRCAVSLLLLAVAFSNAPAQTVEYAGTLPEDYLPGLKPILEQAIKQSPEVLLHEIDIARSEARLIEANSERYPQVGGNLRYDSNRTAATASVSSMDHGLFYSLSVNQSVYHWGIIKNRGNIARIEAAIAEKNYAEAYRALAVQIRQLYLQLVASNARLQAERFSISLRQRDLATARDRLALGSASPTEIAGKSLDLNEAQLLFDRLQADFDSDRRRLSRLAGIKPDIPAEQIPAAIPIPRYDAAVSDQLLAGILRDGAKSTFRAEVADLHTKEAELNYRIAKVRLRPMFNAGLGHSRESTTNASSTNVTQTAITRDTIELRTDWNIFDGFATKGYKLEALADKRTWERQRDIETETIMDEAQRLKRLVEIDARALQYSDERRAGAVSLVKLTEDDLKKAGTTSQTTVDTAQLNLYTAEWNAATTRANFLSDWSAFVSLVADDPALSNLPPRYVRAKR